jgi:hypothetical protein
VKIVAAVSSAVAVLLFAALEYFDFKVLRK